MEVLTVASILPSISSVSFSSTLAVSSFASVISPNFVSTSTSTFSAETVTNVVSSSEDTVPASTSTQITSSPSWVSNLISRASPTSDADKQAWLDGHNALRQQHGASNLTWSDMLESVAQSWANGCVFKHSGRIYGENLFAGSGGVWPISSAINAWTAEAADYDPSNPTYSHFTQMVWKATTELGCALAMCDGIVNGAYGSFHVCEYNPAGNVIGEFAENVQM